jgi:PKHD-type hydroxylase
MSYVTRLVNKSVNKLIFSQNYVIDEGFFTSEECDRISSHCSSLHLSDGGLFTEDTYKTRKAKTAFITEKTWENQWIYDKFNTLIGFYNDNVFGYDLTGYDYMQYTEYDSNGKHEFHMDLAFKTRFTDSPINDRLNEYLRKISVVLLLNEPEKDFSGGQFQFNFSEERLPETAPLKKGSVVLFPSFILHRVLPITEGLRKTLVLWCIGPKFR